MSLNVTRAIQDWPEVECCGIDFKTECNSMYNAITELNLWGMFHEDPGEGGYMFNQGPWDRVFSYPSVVACGHSGASQAVCMRYMQFIADNGWEKFCADINSS
jgi:hypothetical protein